MKRDGNTVLTSLWMDQLFADNSASKAAGLLAQVDFLPKLSQQLQDHPEQVIADFEEIRKHSELAAIL